MAYNAADFNIPLNVITKIIAETVTDNISGTIFMLEKPIESNVFIFVFTSSRRLRKSIVSSN